MKQEEALDENAKLTKTTKKTSMRVFSLMARPFSSFNSREELRRQVLQVTELKKGKNSFCRCWKSQKLPWCDGAHKVSLYITLFFLSPFIPVC
jgi:hypothetical protein